MNSETKKIAIVGAGNWGKNLVRNFCELLGGEQVIICDIDSHKLQRAKSRHPNSNITKDFDNILSDTQINAVVIATPAETHYQLANQALKARKHVLVEKPISLHIQEGIKLLEKAKKSGKLLMVDHLLEYHPAVEELKQRIDQGELGEIQYLYSQRVNLGIVRTKENALWSLGPHDISVFLYLLNKEPRLATAHGGVYLQEEKNIQDVVFLSLEFDDGILAHSHLSWLDPHKIRKMTVVGTKKMMVFDDMESRDKLKIYDKGAKETNEGGFDVRYGDVRIPHIPLKEPLKRMCLHFLDCIENGKQPRSDGYDGLRVLKVLDAAQRSLDNEGKPTLVMNLE